MSAVNVDGLRIDTEQATREAEAFISCGEDILHRAHEVAHDIEEQVRRAMNAEQHELTRPPDAGRK